MSILNSLAYNTSYYLIYFYHSAKNFLWYVTSPLYNKYYDDEEEDIHVSHIYFRPTSKSRGKEQSFSTKILVNHALNVHDYIEWDYVWDDIRDELKNHKYIQKSVLFGDTLEIHYTVPYKNTDETTFRKGYIIPYTYPAKVKFPPYSLEEIRKYYHSQIYKPGILSAEAGQLDLTNELERWVGPLNNFYDDKPFRCGNSINRKLLFGSSDDTQLVITDTYGEDHYYSNGDNISWTKKDKQKKIGDKLNNLENINEMKEIVDKISYSEESSDIEYSDDSVNYEDNPVKKSINEMDFALPELLDDDFL
jgi:hypothetical protein